MYRDGYFKYYESDYSPNAEDFIFMPTECIAIKTGYQVEGKPKPPNGLGIQFLFQVNSINNKVWIFCAESINELKIWISNLEESRLSMIIKSGYPNAFLFNQALARNSSAATMNALMPNPHYYLSTQYLPTTASHASALAAAATNTTSLLPQTSYSNHPFLNNLQPLPPLFGSAGFVPTLPLINLPSPHSSNTFLLPTHPPASYQQQHLSTHHPHMHNSTSPNTPSSLQHPQQANHSPAALSNVARQTILPTTNLPPHLQSMYNSRAESLGLLPPNYQAHPNQFWTSPTVWW